MADEKTLRLPSGRIMKMGLADFTDAKAVFRIVCKELRPLQIKGKDDIVMLFKDLFCTGMASEELEAAVMVCARQCTIDKESVTEALFEKEQYRKDWLPAIIAVWRSAIDPFTSALLQEYAPILEKLSQEFYSMQTTTTSSPSTDSSPPATGV